MAANGFAIVHNVLGEAEVRELLDAVEAADCASGAAGKGGIRNVLDKVPAIRELTDSAGIRCLVEQVLGKPAFVVRGILFDKTPESNWKVPWHQDLTIAVERRIDTPGFGPWTVKDGVQHVQPPTGILEGILAVRIHWDACGAENGPVRVIPGSHSHGRLSAEAIHSMVESSASVTCTAAVGGALLMRPLLLHASSAAISPHHRRVLHLEFSSHTLPGNLRWYENPA